MKTLQIQNQRVRAAQLEKGLSDIDIAELLGVNVSYYRRKVTGQYPWTLQDLEKIQAVTGKTFNYFYGISDY